MTITCEPLDKVIIMKMVQSEVSVCISLSYQILQFAPMAFDNPSL